MDFISGSVLAVGLIILTVFLLLALVASRYKVAKSDEAFIITGSKGKPVSDPASGEVRVDVGTAKVVMSGGVFVVPFVQQLDRISLASRRINLVIRDVLSANNVLLNIEGVAIVKVGGTTSAVRAAAQRFLHQQDEVENFSTETLSGSLRAIIGGLSVEEIIRDRAKLAALVREEAETSLAQQGLVIDTLQIQSVTDGNGYIHNLSRPEAARAEQQAKIAEAAARQAAAEKEAEAEQAIAAAQKDLAIKRAGIKTETDRAEADAAAAGPLAKAAQDQNVLSANEAVAARRAELTARELETTVNKPADAAKYQERQEAEAARYTREQEAEAAKVTAIFEAEAKTAAARLAAEAELSRAEAAAKAVQYAAAAELDKRTWAAKAVKLEGDAEAAAIEAKGNAEAAALLKKAEAFKQYNDAAVTQMALESLPKIAAEIARPLANIDGLTIVSTDGASKLTGMTADVLSQTASVSEALGLDLKAILGNIGKKPEAGDGPTVLPPSKSEK